MDKDLEDMLAHIHQFAAKHQLAFSGVTIVISPHWATAIKANSQVFGFAIMSGHPVMDIRFKVGYLRPATVLVEG